MSPLRESILRGRFSPQAARAALRRRAKKIRRMIFEVLNAVLSDVTAGTNGGWIAMAALKFMCSHFVPNILEQLSRT